jgi:hypothetical protein
MGFVTQPSIAKRPESGAPSIRELHSRGSRPAIGLCVIELTLGAVSVCTEDGGFLHLEGGSYGTLSETVGGALRGAKARTTVTASRDDVFEDISQADARNGNPERDGFRST